MNQERIREELDAWGLQAPLSGSDMLTIAALLIAHRATERPDPIAAVDSIMQYLVGHVSYILKGG